MARKGMMVGKGSGYKNVVGRDPAVHSQSAKGIKQPQAVNIITPKKESPISISGHNYSMDIDGNKMKLSLGNLSDAGWYWDGKEEDFTGFLIRLNSSQEKQKFLNDLKEKNVPFDRLKPFLINSAEKGDGLYELSGDNARWHFGEGSEEDIDELLYDTEEELTPAQKDKFKKNYQYDADTSFETFEKEYKGKYIKEIKELANRSTSVSDFFDNLDLMKDDWNEKVYDWESNQQQSNFTMNWQKFKKEEKI
jgi:hypothetical protein